MFTGSHSHGQGHETTFAQIVAGRLGIPIEDVEIVHGDTGRVLFGMGTYGSRSLAIGGTAIVKALDKVISKGKKIAAHLMEAADADIDFKDGKFEVAGTDKQVPFAQVALAAYVPHNYPLDKLEPGLNEQAFYDPANCTFPAGSHICEVEVDPDTGATQIVDYTAVDDFGNIINPLIVAGQVHGGLAQGIGQALLEGCRYDEQTGQLLTGSYLDYVMPRAADLPEFNLATEVTPCTHNPLGVKGCGESGAIAAAAAVMNALTDAIGVRDLEMPASPERVWRALREAAAEAVGGERWRPRIEPMSSAKSIRDWLTELGLAQHAEAFEREQIDLDAVRHLTEDDLKDLGLPMGHRVKLLAAIRALQRKPRPGARRASRRLPPRAYTPRHLAEKILARARRSKASASR